MKESFQNRQILEEPTDQIEELTLEVSILATNSLDANQQQPRGMDPRKITSY